MSLFQIISLIPLLLLYSVISIKAWGGREYDNDGWVAAWIAMNIILCAVLPAIAFVK